MVCFEAARAIIHLPGVRDEDLAPVISMLQNLGSSRACEKFAAIRVLNELSVSHPMAIEGCSSDLEALVNDANRSVATLAVSTLLKTVEPAKWVWAACVRRRIESLLKQIASYLTEIDDEFKQLLVKSLLTLTAKYPEQYSVILTFLSSILRGVALFPVREA